MGFNLYLLMLAHKMVVVENGRLNDAETEK
jgi:hypothetical protein